MRLTLLLIAVTHSLPAQTLYTPGGTIGNNTTNNNVGVGTSNPQQKLDVNGGLRTAAGSLTILSDYLYVSPENQNTFNSGYGINGVADAWINYRGYNDGFTQPRNFNVGDGMGHVIAWFDGTNRRLSINNNQWANNTLSVNGTADFSGYVGIGISSPNPSIKVTIQKDLTDNYSAQLELRPLETSTGSVSRVSKIRFRASFDNYPGDQSPRVAAGLQAGYNGGTWGNEYLAIQVGGSDDGGKDAMERMRITGAGNVGIGTVTPLRAIHIYAGNGYAEQLWEAGAVSASSVGRIWRWGTSPSGSFTAGTFNSDLSNGFSVLTLANTGNVGIGTANPTYPLTVNGAIRAKEVIVDTGWSDYVFDEHYKLAPLSEVESHIKAEKHLPGIPSAQEVAAQGISLGEMQAKLLAKIEELTLHQIEQEKKLSAQSTQLAEQSARIERLEAENAALKPKQ